MPSVPLPSTFVRRLTEPAPSGLCVVDDVLSWRVVLDSSFDEVLTLVELATGLNAAGALVAGPARQKRCVLAIALVRLGEAEEAATDIDAELLALVEDASSVDWDKELSSLLEVTSNTLSTTAKLELRAVARDTAADLPAKLAPTGVALFEGPYAALLDVAKVLELYLPDLDSVVPSVSVPKKRRFFGRH